MSSGFLSRLNCTIALKQSKACCSSAGVNCRKLIAGRLKKLGQLVNWITREAFRFQQLLELACRHVILYSMPCSWRSAALICR